MIYCSNPLAQYQSNKEDIIEAVQRVLDGGHYVLGTEVAAFEKSFADYCGVQHGVGVNSGTDALILALRALEVGPGDEVITVSHTALATIAAIIATGATPILVDIEPDYYTLDPESFKKAITSKTKVVIPVHLYGQPADMDSILAIAREYDLFVIEDCAQAAGATYKGKRVGCMGDIGCFSFYPTKNLGGIGDGGMAVTDNETLAIRIRRLGQYGWDNNRITLEPGLNSRLDEIQAAILNVKLKTLDVDNAKRKKIAQKYNGVLSSLQVSLPAERESCNHVFHLYVVACDFRIDLQSKMKDAGIMLGIHYAVPGHKHPGYDLKCSFSHENLSVTNKAVDTVLSLPMYPEISLEQIDLIANSIL